MSHAATELGKVHSKGMSIANQSKNITSTENVSMDNFFHGWRRKMGAATLLLTLLLTGGWVRSLSVLDQLSIPIGKSTGWYVISQYHYLVWTFGDELARPNCIHWEAVSLSVIPEVESFIADNQSLLSQLQWPGIGVVESSTEAGSRGDKPSVIKYWCVSYVVLVIPLTLLSASLLMVNPTTSCQYRSLTRHTAAA